MVDFRGGKVDCLILFMMVPRDWGVLGLYKLVVYVSLYFKCVG